VFGDDRVRGTREQMMLLLVFGDDRVRGTREQMMLQVDLVRHRARAGLVRAKRVF